MKNPFNQKTVLINGTEYTINRMVATKALSLQPKVMKLIGRTAVNTMLSQDPSQANDVQDESQMQADLIAKSAELFIEDFEKIDIVSLSKELLSSVFKGSACVELDTEFTGDLGSLYQLLFEVIKFNYLDSLIKLVSDRK